MSWKLVRSNWNWHIFVWTLTSRIRVYKKNEEENTVFACSWHFDLYYILSVLALAAIQCDYFCRFLPFSISITMNNTYIKHKSSIIQKHMNRRIAKKFWSGKMKSQRDQQMFQLNISAAVAFTQTKIAYFFQQIRAF